MRRSVSVRYLRGVTLADPPRERYFAGAPTRAALAALAVVVTLGCKAKPKPPPPAPAPSVSVSAAPAPEAAPRCRSRSASPSLRVGDADRAAAVVPDEDGSDDDEAAAQPFATRVDSALALDDAFAVGGLETRGGKTEAFVAWVPLGGGAGQRVGLGEVHGDVDPPLVAGRGKTLVVAVADMDAGGGMLRIHRLDRGVDKPQGELAFTGVEHDVGSALALGELGAALVFGTKRPQGVGLKLALFEPKALTGTPVSQELERTLHAESPVLRARPGGFWLAWISEQPSKAHPDAGAPTDASAHDDESDAPLVSSGPRVLLVLPLDGAGKAVGFPRSVSADKAHVLGFEAATLPDGALALTFREDEASPGVERGPPDLARVTLDGTIEHAKIEDEDLSAGLPALLVDARPGGRTWVALEGASGGTRLGRLKEGALALESLVADRVLRGADVLAAGDGALLVSRNRGRAVELDVVECRPSP